MTESGQNLPWLEKVEKLAQEIALREGCVLYDLEFMGAGGTRALRIYIDRDMGPSIDDCSNISKGLNLILDVEDVIPGGAYQLEVSTPGLDRHLRLAWHFEKVVGKKIWVRTKDSFEVFGNTQSRWAKAKQIENVLTGIENDYLLFNVEDALVKIPRSAVQKAKVVFEMTKGQKK